MVVVGEKTGRGRSMVESGSMVEEGVIKCNYCALRVAPVTAATWSRSIAHNSQLTNADLITDLLGVLSSVPHNPLETCHEHLTIVLKPVALRVEHCLHSQFGASLVKQLEKDIRRKLQHIFDKVVVADVVPKANEWHQVAWVGEVARLGRLLERLARKIETIRPRVMVIASNSGKDGLVSIVVELGSQMTVAGTDVYGDDDAEHLPNVLNLCKLWCGPHAQKPAALRLLLGAEHAGC